MNEPLGARVSESTDVSTSPPTPPLLSFLLPQRTSKRKNEGRDQRVAQYPNDSRHAPYGEAAHLRRRSRRVSLPTLVEEKKNKNFRHCCAALASV